MNKIQIKKQSRKGSLFGKMGMVLPGRCRADEKTSIGAGPGGALTMGSSSSASPTCHYLLGPPPNRSKPPLISSQHHFKFKDRKVYREGQFSWDLVSLPFFSQVENPVLALGLQGIGLIIPSLVSQTLLVDQVTTQ